MPTDARRIYTERVGAYLRLLRIVGYARGLEAYFSRSDVLAPGLRILDAGCGSGVASLALRSTLAGRGLTPRAIDGFDLSQAMLDRFRATISERSIEGIRLARADVFHLEALPPDWRDYDLVVSSAMLEYVPRARFPEALSALRERLRPGGRLLLFISRDNLLTRPLIGRWWSANLYRRSELCVAFETARYGELSFDHFPGLYRYLDLWGWVLSAPA